MVLTRNVVIEIGSSYCTLTTSDGFELKTKSRVFISLRNLKPLPYLYGEDIHIHSFNIRAVELFSDDTQYHFVDLMINLLLKEMRKQNRFWHFFQKEKITLLLPYSFDQKTVDDIVKKLNQAKIFPCLVTTKLDCYCKMEQERIYDEFFEHNVRVI